MGIGSIKSRVLVGFSVLAVLAAACLLMAAQAAAQVSTVGVKGGRISVSGGTGSVSSGEEMQTLTSGSSASRRSSEAAGEELSPRRQE